MKFKVFQGIDNSRGSVKRNTQFYFHVRSSNGKITLQSEGYPTLAHAIRATKQVWKSFAKATDSQFSALTGKLFESRCPVPYTRDSLKPATPKNPFGYDVKKPAPRL